MANIVAIIVAAGTGQRMKETMPMLTAEATIHPKQYMSVNGQVLLRHAVRPFLNHDEISEILCVIHPDHTQLYKEHMSELGIMPPVLGDSTRQGSVRNALVHLAEQDIKPDYVLIHDAARPLVSRADIDAVLTPLTQGLAKGASLSIKVSDSFRRGVHKNRICFAGERVLRDNLYALQTPQGFHFDTLYEAHMAEDRSNHTDDTSLLSEKDIDIVLAEGRMMNLKVTSADDLEIVKKMLA